MGARNITGTYSYWGGGHLHGKSILPTEVLLTISSDDRGCGLHILMAIALHVFQPPMQRNKKENKTKQTNMNK